MRIEMVKVLGVCGIHYSDICGLHVCVQLSSGQVIQLESSGVLYGASMGAMVSALEAAKTLGREVKLTWMESNVRMGIDFRVVSEDVFGDLS